MKKHLLILLALFPVVAVAQDRCPSFKVERSRNSMHYDFSLPVYRKKFPRKGNSVFVGGYANVVNPGAMLKMSVNMPEYHMAMGWEASSRFTPITVIGKNSIQNSETMVDVFAATISTFHIINEKAILEAGLMYGSVISNQREQYAGLQGTASYRVWRDVWLSTNIQFNNFQTTPDVRFGLATIIWNYGKKKRK